MRFGLFGGGKTGRLNPLGDSHGYKDFIAYVNEADQLGSKSVFLDEHHFTGVGDRRAEILKNYRRARAPARIDRCGRRRCVIGSPAEIIDKLNRFAGGAVEYVLLTSAVIHEDALAEFFEENAPHMAQRKVAAAA